MDSEGCGVVGSSFWGLRCPVRIYGPMFLSLSIIPWDEDFLRPPVSHPHTPNTTPLHDPESIFFLASSMNWLLYHQHRLEQHICLQDIFLQKLDVFQKWYCAMAEFRKPVSVSHAADHTVSTIGHRQIFEAHVPTLDHPHIIPGSATRRSA